MALDDALMVLTAVYWDEVWSGLDDTQRSRLQSAAGDLISQGSDDERLNAAALRLLSLVREVLPEDHPVLDAADETYRWAQQPPIDWPPLVDMMSERLAAAVSIEVRARLAGSPALSPDQVRVTNSDPRQPFLIRLESGSGLRFPAFQFDPAGRPVDTVLRINEWLGADEDPWGVADWWLGANAWLDAVPADLIGTRDDLLLAAAQAVTREDEG